jgi:multicomponent Na+:H+ antiporter subunit E
MSARRPEIRSSNPPRSGAGGVPAWRGFARRALLFSLLWLVLTGGDTGGPYLALPIIAIASWVSMRTLPPGGWRLSAPGILRFVPFFLIYSLRGGIDVAGRALGARLRLQPAVLAFELRLDDPAAITFVATAFSLFPGTIAVQVQGRSLHVHTLDTALPVEAHLRELEARAAGMFHAPLEDRE